MLAGTGHALQLLNLCIYNERPIFLRGPSARGESTLTTLREGLDALATLWKRGNKAGKY